MVIQLDTNIKRNIMTQTKQYIVLGDTANGCVMFDPNFKALGAINRTEDLTEVKEVRMIGKKGSVAYWGKQNDLPQRREDLIQDNNIVGQLIRTNRDILIGGGIKYFKKEIQEGEEVLKSIIPNSEVLEFMDHIDSDDVNECAAGEYCKHGNIFFEVILDQKKSKISNIYPKRCVNIRAAKQNSKGQVKSYFLSGNWKNSTSRTAKLKTVELPAFDPDNPLKYAKSIFHTGDKLFFDGYYYSPAWWGGKNWIIAANKIPEFHFKNLDNGYLIRYHIQIPKNHFLDKMSYDAADEDKREQVLAEAESTEKAFITQMNNFLAGTKGAGRAVYTKYFSDLEKAHPGIKIEAIKTDMKDEALLKLYEKSNDANISAQGIHPVLASIQTQGKLSSGSDIRNALLLHLATKTPVPRKALLRIFNIIKKVNKWDQDLVFGFKDNLITKLDEEKSGQKQVMTE